MKRYTSLTLALLLAILVSACNFPFMENSEDTLATTVAKTMEALEEQTLPTLPALPTMTPYPTATPYPVETATVAPTKVTVACLYASAVDKTIPDGTKFSAGETFTKTWTFTNTGTCDWNVDYELVFKKGDKMSGLDAVKISKETDPGEKIDISVELKAPASAGTYTGIWQLKSDDGVKFGEVWVKIVVE